MGPRAQAFSFSPYEIATPMYIYIYTHSLLMQRIEDKGKENGSYNLGS
jgi:hypothetical protein